MDQELKDRVIRDDQQVAAAGGLRTNDRHRLGQAGGSDDVDRKVIRAGCADGGWKKRGRIVYLDLERVTVLERNDNTLADLPRHQRHLKRVAILPEAGIDKALAVGGGRRDGADEVHAGFEIGEGEGAIGGGGLGLAKALGGDGDGGLDGVIGFVADRSREGRGGGGGRQSLGGDDGLQNGKGDGSACDRCNEFHLGSVLGSCWTQVVGG